MGDHINDIRARHGRVEKFFQTAPRGSENLHCNDLVRATFQNDRAALLDRIEQLEAKLARVEGLPDEWRERNWHKSKCDEDWQECANELEAKLKGPNEQEVE